MLEKAGQNPTVTGAPAPDAANPSVTHEAGEPGGPQQQQGSAQGGSLFERVGRAAGLALSQAGAAIDDPQKAGEQLLEAVKNNPGKTAAAAGAVYVGVSGLLLGGAAAAIGGAVRTGQHMQNGLSFVEAVTTTRDEVVDLTAQAGEIKDQAVSEAKKAFGAAKAWWGSLANKGGDQGGGDNA